MIEAKPEGEIRRKNWILKFTEFQNSQMPQMRYNDGIFPTFH